MALLETLGIQLRLREAIAVGMVVALLSGLILTPRVIRKLRGAGIVGQDRQKPGAPEIPEMGGLAVFLAFNAGVFAILATSDFSEANQTLILSALVVCAGALVTGVLDDLIVLRQRFKAFIPFVFAAPLALYATSTQVTIPTVGPVGFGILYTLVLVPAGVACASNGFNMLEGFNGLGAGLGIILAGALSFLALLHGSFTGLVILFPLVGALGAFLWFNAYPARVFPGDTMTLLVGAALATGAILCKVEFWGALLFLPHVLEFFLKARGGFAIQSFATRLDGDRLVYDGPVRSLTHIVMRRGPFTEPGVVVILWSAEAVYALGVVGLSLVLA